MPEPTPGQVAYETWVREMWARWPTLALAPWDILPFAEQAPWDAAAQAVGGYAARQRAWAADVYDAAWAQIAQCDCTHRHRLPVGELCAACASLKTIAEAAQAALAWQEEAP